MFQHLSAWADGPTYVTQCPIRPGHSYTYKFNITGQEGTLWWHAHMSWLRATVYGALIIRPRSGHRYPFPKPHKEIPILLGNHSFFLFIFFFPWLQPFLVLELHLKNQEREFYSDSNHKNQFILITRKFL